MSMNEQDLAAIRDELIAARQHLDEQRAHLEEKEQAWHDAHAAYSAIPTMGGVKALANVGLPIGGAIAGGMITKHPGGMALGGLAGIAGAIGANAMINHHLNKKYPDREALHEAYRDAREDYHQHYYGDYDDAADAYATNKLEAVDAAHANPGLWSQVTQGAEGYPQSEMQKAILMKKKEERALAAREAQRQDQLRRLELEAKRHEVTGAGKQNDLVDQQISGHKLTNLEKAYNLANQAKGNSEEE